MDRKEVLNYKWITRNGKVIKFGDMSVSHLVNCVKMVRRQLAYYREEEKACYNVMGMLRGEQALIDCDRAALRLSRQVESHESTLALLLKACEYRNIDVDGVRKTFDKYNKRQINNNKNFN